MRDGVILTEILSTHRSLFFLTDRYETNGDVNTHLNILEKAETDTLDMNTIVVRLKCVFYSDRRPFVHNCDGRTVYR